MEARVRVVFLGTPEWAVPALEALAESSHEVATVVSAPDRPVGRSRKPRPTPVKSAALELGIQRILQPETLRGAGPRGEILACEPDVLAVVAFGKILPGRLLDAPAHGAVNLHFSLLPRHRGASPVQHTLLMGDEMAGVSTMQMDRGLDTGPILLQEEVEILEGERSPELGERLARVGAALLVETLDGLEAGRVEPRAQDESLATLAPLLTKEEGHVDWRHPALDIERKTRAFAGWPAVVCEGPKGRLRLLRARALHDRTHSGEPAGRVLSREGDAVLVACGESSVLALDEVQPAGSRAMAAAAALAGAYLAVGQELSAPDEEGLGSAR
jgi:methionyl-tRNA formyltransferase